ncbi:MAG: SDR family NAD(P)-dependent oxidoreductase [Rhodospirillales bacterium]|nr:SDR family NAD(P)-dependent oxidoreductase [Rhodospirillales bacterium]MDE0380204.1 SDR family NAD(P)-dependent oxidoreductase [Rhodospirillales bacterium]MDE0392919.1 SDR family NAD(P)-dependent oxidoreductase [Rhodospirillales bacterium]
MDGSFQDRTVIVTGAGHGFGRAIAHTFAARGAWVWGCDINEEALAVTAREARDEGRLTVGPLDVTDRVAVRDYVASVEARRGGVDILVNNAGGVVGQTGQPLEAVSEEAWHAIVDVNMTAVFTMVQAVAPGMKAAGYGRVVNISSGAGLRFSLTGIQAYAAAKAGQIGLTRQLAFELGPHGISVNGVAPGFVRSNPMTERQWDAMGAGGQAALIESMATRRLGSADDIAHAVLFFASEDSGWITGQTLSVDGGRL